MMSIDLTSANIHVKLPGCNGVIASLLDSATIWERPASTFRASFQRHRISFGVHSHLLERNNIDIPWFSSTCCCYKLKPFFLTSQHRVNLEIAPWILGGSQALHQRNASKPLRHWWTSARCLRDFTLWSVGVKGRQSDTVVYLEHLWHNHEYLNVWCLAKLRCSTQVANRFLFECKIPLMNCQAPSSQLFHGSMEFTNTAAKGLVTLDQIKDFTLRAF